LKRAALMIKEIAGGKISSEVIDVYPRPKDKTEVSIKYHYLKKLSGKNYHADAVKRILLALGFEMRKEGQDEMRLAVPFSKPDISIPADIVEEIMRIDGLDNIEIPSAITISPSVESLFHEASYKEKVANFLTGTGFSEIFTNSITNSAYFSDEVLQTSVKMINSLSAELNVMRPAMLETGLDTVAYNLNRKNTDLLLFEFSKTYKSSEVGKYLEQEHLSIYITGKKTLDGWKSKGSNTDYYFTKAVTEKIIESLGLKITEYVSATDDKLENFVQVKTKNQVVASIGSVNRKTLNSFDIKQPVLFADLNWEKLLELNKKIKIEFAGIPKFPAVHRDLSIIVDKSLTYEQVEKATWNTKVNKLKSVNLFDIFESDKLGANKKSMAMSFTFLDEEKTMTDNDIDMMMSKIIASYEKELNAEVRK